MKQARTIDEQLNILKQRGLIINNYDEAAKMLSNVNYYTLTGYLFPFKNKNKYIDGTSIELAISLYQFDNQLRSILTSLVTEAEEKLKTRVAYNLAITHKDDPLIYTDINFFKNSDEHIRFMADFQNNIRTNQEVPFVKHHMRKYRSQFPIWVAVNLFTMGNLKYLYKNIPSRDRKNISKGFNVSPTTMDSWIDTLRILRNKLAHNMRLYDTTFQKTPKLEEHHKIKSNNNRLFSHIILFKYLLENSENWRKSILLLHSLFEEYNQTIQLSTLGFPEDWKEIVK